MATRVKPASGDVPTDRPEREGVGKGDYESSSAASEYAESRWPLQPHARHITRIVRVFGRVRCGPGVGLLRRVGVLGLNRPAILPADDPGSIWLNKHGLPLTPTAVNHAFNRHSGKFGISVTPHTLRHSYAMVKYDHDVKAEVSDPMRTLQLGLRHKSPATTIDVYYHRGSEDLAREAEADQSRLDRIREGCTSASTPRNKH